ncbi:MAG: hypothetical protein LBM63_05215 [Rikenellaceae bacterium]|jgi:transposase|nr:hypothetical protein [Rikenellaceae bacterium]
MLKNQTNLKPMNRHYLLLLSVALFVLTSTTHAQVTPEAIIGQTPDLPSVAHLAAIIQDEESYDAASNARTAFHAKIAELRDKSDEAVERINEGAQSAAMSDAERITQQMTGRSMSQLQNMSKADEEKLAEEIVARQLGAAGLGGMTLGQLQALEGKSDEEIMSAMSASGVTVGGLSIREIQAMEKMSDEQIAAYMQQGDRMQRVQAAAPTAQQSRNIRAKQRDAQEQVDASAEMKRITDRWAEIDRVNQNEVRDVVAKLAELDAKYEGQYPPDAGEVFESGTAAQIEAMSRTVNKIRRAEDSEKFTLWRGAVSRMQGRVKSKMADVARYDQLLAQTMSSGGMTATARTMPSVGYDIAGQYLDLTSSVTKLPEAN